MSSTHGDNYNEWFNHQLKVAKVDILAKTEGLVTRQTLRDEKWAEYTLRQILALSQEEERGREVIQLDESPYTTFFTRWSLQLERLVVEGTVGTVIHVEESEGVARSDVLVDAESCFKHIIEPFSISQEYYKRKEIARIERERCECGVVEAAEQVDRFTISEEYEVEWPEVWREEVVKRKEVTLLLLWRVVLLECDERLAIESNEMDSRGMLPLLGTASFVEWVPSILTEAVPVVFVANDTPPPPSPNAAYSHFGHEYKTVPIGRSPGREPAPTTLFTNHIDECPSISCPSEPRHDDEDGDVESDDDVSEGSLLRLRGEVCAGWDSV